MPPTKGNFRNYTQETMQTAVEYVRLHKTPYKTAAKKFNVPRITLKYKVEGKTPIQRKMGPNRVLTEQEEKTIKGWIINMAHAGFPVTQDQVMGSVQRILKELKRPNPFKDDRPGKSWLKGFMKKYPEIVVRTSQNLTKTRANLSKENIRNWFSEVEVYLTESGHQDILLDPTRIFNTDESAFFLNPSGGKVLAKKGDKTFKLLFE